MSTNSKSPENALFVCFGGMSNVGALTGIASLEVVKQVGGEKAAVFCLAGLPTGAQTVLNKTRAARQIIAVDGCPLNCASKVVAQAGFTPDKIINLVEDCGVKKGPTFDYTDEDLQTAVEAILGAVEA
ncbi:MAG: putative zinc-binding protein [Anaerolineae bacterium]|nr:putative zinc-binding protein [Anaerolineae bacterium]